MERDMKKYTKELLPPNASPNTPPEKNDSTVNASPEDKKQKYLKYLRDSIQLESLLHGYVQKVRSLGSHPKKKWYMVLRKQLENYVSSVNDMVKSLDKEDYRHIYPKIYDRYTNNLNTAKTLLGYLVQLNPREF